ncbi:MAG: hypothetical protein ACN4GR_11045 [Arenicellales bacterium]
MKKLSSDLKRALVALAHQDACDYLSMHEKNRAIGYSNDAEKQSFNYLHLVSNSFTKKRIAMISDGRGLGSPLDYAIDACKRQNADIDLLLHGEFDTAGISVIESHIRDAGIQCQRIQLAANSIDNILEYISMHPSLIFVVGLPNDSIAKVLMEEIIPSPDCHIAIPLVLIDGKKSDKPGKQTAA